MKRVTIIHIINMVSVILVQTHEEIHIEGVKVHLFLIYLISCENKNQLIIVLASM